MAGNKNSGRKLDKWWGDAVRKAVMQVDDGDPDGRKKLDLIAEALAEKACAGDIQAIKEIGDRLDGKPKQSIEAEHSASVPGLRELLDQIDGTSCGLPSED